MKTPDKINLADKFARFSAHWSPKIVAALNGQHVKLVKFAGEFVIVRILSKLSRS